MVDHIFQFELDYSVLITYINRVIVNSINIIMINGVFIKKNTQKQNKTYYCMDRIRMLIETSDKLLF